MQQVEVPDQGWCEVDTLLGQHELEAWPPLEHAAPDQLGEPAVAEQVELRQVEQLRLRRFAGVGRTGAGMRGQGRTDGFAHVPEAVVHGIGVVGVVLTWGVEVHHSEPGRSTPLHLTYGGIDVPDRDLHHAAQPVGRDGCEVGDPVIPHPMEASFSSRCSGGPAFQPNPTHGSSVSFWPPAKMTCAATPSASMFAQAHVRIVVTRTVPAVPELIERQVADRRRPVRDPPAGVGDHLVTLLRKLILRHAELVELRQVLHGAVLPGNSTDGRGPA